MTIWYLSKITKYWISRCRYCLCYLIWQHGGPKKRSQTICWIKQTHKSSQITTFALQQRCIRSLSLAYSMFLRLTKAKSAHFRWNWSELFLLLLEEMGKRLSNLQNSRLPHFVMKNAIILPIENNCLWKWKNNHVAIVYNADTCPIMTLFVV